MIMALLRWFYQGNLTFFEGFSGLNLQNKLKSCKFCLNALKILSKSSIFRILVGEDLFFNYRPVVLCIS
jgi:hypothetical protein